MDLGKELFIQKAGEFPGMSLRLKKHRSERNIKQQQYVNNIAHVHPIIPNLYLQQTAKLRKFRSQQRGKHVYSPLEAVFQEFLMGY